MIPVKSALLSLFLAAATLAGAPAMAVPTVITFDAGDPIGGLAAGAVLANQYAAYGVTFAPNALAGGGGPYGDWATNTSMTIASVGGDVGGLGTPSLVSGNLLRSYSGWLNENGDPSFSASFSGGITSFSADFAGVATAADVHLYAYLGTTLVQSVTGASGGQFTLALAGSGLFDRVVITPGSWGDWAGVDNIAFDRAETPPTGVPEPATMAIMALGLAGVAITRRRRQGH